MKLYRSPDSRDLKTLTVKTVISGGFSSDILTAVCSSKLPGYLKSITLVSHSVETFNVEPPRWMDDEQRRNTEIDVFISEPFIGESKPIRAK